MKLIPIQNSDDKVMVDDWWYEPLLGFGPWYRDGKGAVCKKGWTKMHYLVTGFDEVDHVDMNLLNNQESNLRRCTRSQNMANTNKRVTNTSGFKGVSWHSQTNKWRAYIKVDYKQKALGLFDSKEDAARAYDEAAKKYFGEFARLNFPASPVQ